MRVTVRLCYLIILLQIVSWVCVTSRHLASHNGHHHDVLSGTGESPHPQVSLNTREDHKVCKKGEAQEEIYQGVKKKIGSSPPSCEHKCYGCMPCEATQVPTITSRIGLQYTNYEPEGWKCKCGPSFYSP